MELSVFEVFIDWRDIKNHEEVAHINTYTHTLKMKSFEIEKKIQEEKERMEEAKCKRKGEEKTTDCIRTEESRERVK